jgi:hypothetical protein
MTNPAWPRLLRDEWDDTYATLHRWTQILGKTRLALSPVQNHWWHCALYVSTAGLTTSPIPYRDRTFEVELDLVGAQLVVRDCDGAIRTRPLIAEPVADFYAGYLGLLRSLDLDVKIWPVPSEVADRTRFSDDRTHASYDADAARRCHVILRHADRVIKGCRGDFLGKQSPVHFWWGGFDLACTTFSGRRAPTHPGGVPYIPDAVVREAYSHECTSVGWWPGVGGGEVREPAVREAAFYAYASPQPEGFAQLTTLPAAAYYHPTMGEWILPYEAVRSAADPDASLRTFVEGVYVGCAELGGWDRAALERPR